MQGVCKSAEDAVFVLSPDRGALRLSQKVLVGDVVKPKQKTGLFLTLNVLAMFCIGNYKFHDCIQLTLIDIMGR